MQPSNHTPGPWHVEDTNSAKLHCVVSPDEKGSNNGWVVIGQVGGPHKDANARLIAAAPTMKAALAGMLDAFGGYECPEVDAAIAAMQQIGEDRWSMQAQMDAAKEGGAA